MSNRVQSLRLVWLEALLAVKNHGSQAEAGRRLGLTHAMIGRYLRQLEDWYDRPVFADESDQLLNPEGERLAAVAEVALRILGQVRSAGATDAHQPILSDTEGKELAALASLPRTQAALEEHEMRSILRQLVNIAGILELAHKRASTGAHIEPNAFPSVDDIFDQIFPGDPSKRR